MVALPESPGTTEEDGTPWTSKIHREATHCGRDGDTLPVSSPFDSFQGQCCGGITVSRQIFFGQGCQHCNPTILFDYGLTIGDEGAG